MKEVMVPISRVEEFKKKLSKLANKASKYNVKFSYKQLPQETETIRVEIEDCPGMWITHMREVFPFIIESDEIRLGDYSVLGVIEHSPIGIMINGSDNIAKEFQNVSQYRCDHCKTNHTRKIQVILKNDKGETLIVGKSCVKEYTGCDVQNYFKWNHELDNIDEYQKSNFEPAYSIEDIFNVSVEIINKDGFKPTSDGFEKSTANNVIFKLKKNKFTFVYLYDKILIQQREITNELSKF